jgi:DNA repair photolyase
MMKASYKPTVLMLSGNTDCYQPAERKFRITRSILETLLEFKHPVGIITKNALITRDTDILSEMAKLDLVMVNFSITTLDLELSRKLEPRTATPQRKLEALRKLTDAGIPCGVMNAPIIPGLNDKETPNVLKAAAEYGAITAGYTIMRLSYGLRDIFEDWLKKNIPLEENRILSRIRMVRDGELTSTKWGERMRGNGAYADYIKNQFKVMSRKYGLNQTHIPITTKHFERPGTLFG